MRESGNEVIVQVKTNQQALLRCLDHVVATQRPVAVETSRQRGRNRQEDRRITVYAAGSALERTPWSPLITAIVRVERDTLLRSAATGQWTRRRETSLYAASVMLPAQTFASAIQNHWAIENRNHWVRDVTLAEDARPDPGQSGHHGTTAQSGPQHRPGQRRHKHRTRPLDRRPRSKRHPRLQRLVKSVEQPCAAGGGGHSKSPLRSKLH